MNKQQILAQVIGVTQLALGFALLAIPGIFFDTFGFTPVSPDQKYMYGQLAARFVAYGIGMFYIARAPQQNRFWWDMMALVQGIDLGVGLLYSLALGVSFAITAFPMFNAALFLVLLILWRPDRPAEAV